MKIDEPLTLILNQTPNKQSHANLDFELWLNTPTKQSSGDEYYWQHQEQLQQSDLQFDSRPLINRQQQENVTENQYQLINPLAVPKTMNMPIKNCNLIVPGEIINKSYSNIVELPESCMQKEQKSPTTITAYALNNTSIRVNSHEQLEEIKINSDSRTLYTFKNHHLFIQDQDAELTLNNQDMDAQEEKELIHTIKHLLKNKGITLNKLIINGVKHD